MNTLLEGYGLVASLDDISKQVRNSEQQLSHYPLVKLRKEWYQIVGVGVLASVRRVVIGTNSACTLNSLGTYMTTSE